MHDDNSVDGGHCSGCGLEPCRTLFVALSRGDRVFGLYRNDAEMGVTITTSEEVIDRNGNPISYRRFKEEPADWGGRNS